MAKDILVETESCVATVTFNRPLQRNAIDHDGWLNLTQIAEELAGENEVKVIIFTGSVDAFSAGADIKDFDQHRHNSASAERYAKVFDGALDAIEAIPKPTISKIKGYCIGGGCELSMATDIRIAADNARFAIPVAKLGILVGYKEMRRLVRLVGPGYANYILMSGRQLGAQDSLRIGLVSEVKSMEEIDSHVEKLATEMTPLAPLSQSRHKQILQIVLRNPGLSHMTDKERDLPFMNFDSQDFQEGRQAFAEHRDPVFTGR